MIGTKKIPTIRPSLRTRIAYDRTNAVVKYCMQSIQLEAIVSMGRWNFYFWNLRDPFAADANFLPAPLPSRGNEFPSMSIRKYSSRTTWRVKCCWKIVFKFMIIFFFRIWIFTRDTCEIPSLRNESHLQWMARNLRSRANAWRAFQWIFLAKKPSVSNSGASSPILASSFRRPAIWCGRTTTPSWVENTGLTFS